MAASTDFPTRDIHLETQSYAAQYIRQRLAENWQPRGFNRFPNTKALLDEMPVLGGPFDLHGAGTNPQRYQPVPPCMENLDCHCGE